MSANSKTLGKIKANIEKREKAWDKVPFSVLLWAPGDSEKLKNKREHILKALEEHGFDVHTGEAVAEHTKSKLRLGDEELSHWRQFNAVIVLEGGVATAMEVASYSLFADFCEKCIVFHPVDWSPSTRGRTYPSDILAIFPNRFPYRDEDINKCMLVEECLHRVTALKRIRVLRSNYAQDFLAS